MLENNEKVIQNATKAAFLEAQLNQSNEKLNKYKGKVEKLKSNQDPDALARAQKHIKQLKNENKAILSEMAKINVERVQLQE